MIAIFLLLAFITGCMDAVDLFRAYHDGIRPDELRLFRLIAGVIVCLISGICLLGFAFQSDFQ